MSFLLDAAYFLLALLASPCILFRMAQSKRWRAGLRQRLGFVPPRPGGKPCLWLHAVSVGEVNLSRPLVSAFLQERPDWDVRISATTDTGMKVAAERYGAERCLYFPLDFSLAVRRTFRRVRPTAIVLMELEAWPNFARAARACGAPVVIMNGRMREESVARYRAARFLFRPLLDPRGPNLFCVQNEAYRDRFVRAGFPPEKIRITGNMKYDAVRTEADPARLAPIRDALALAPADRAWIAACTWPGEEEICLRVHRLLQEHVPELRLVIAPRHVERADQVARLIEKSGFGLRRRTAATGPAGPAAVALLDTIGELGYAYAVAEFAFVGKSLTARGGHNVLEPAALGVVPVFGPFTGNFEEEARILLDAGAAERVAGEADLSEALLRLAREPAVRQERARKGREAVLARQGATRRHLDVLRQLLTSASAGS